MIAKALSHEPQILFLDEPTAGVDVELRKDMWEVVRALRASGVTIILTTHYIEEAEEMADRIGVINKGEIILVEDKAELMRKLGKKQLTLQLQRAARRRARRRSRGYRARRCADDGSELDLHLRHAGRAHRHHRAAATICDAPASRFKDLADDAELARGHLRRPGEERRMNLHAVRAIYVFEMARTGRTLLQSIVSPVISTSLYFVVFGAAIGSRITEIDGVSYGAFIVPGLIMLMLLTQSITQRLVRHLLPDASSARSTSSCRRRCRTLEIVHRLCRRGGDQVDHPRADHPGHRARCSCRCEIAHPFWMLAFLVLTAVTFSLFGFIIGIWADGFEKLQVVPLLIITPLTFLGGTLLFDQHAAAVLAERSTLFNPVVYLISGFRWSFFEIADVNVGDQPRR